MSIVFESKLPQRPASIFSTMSSLAQQHQAINLSQGFPDYAVDPVLTNLIHQHLQQGHNQYAPMAGVLALRQSIAAKYQHLYGLDIDAEQEVTVTAGATQALFTAIASLVRPDDEVVIFEPAYDSYAVTVSLFGGKIVPIRLYAPEFVIDWDEVKSKITTKTRLIIINHPNNPSGKVLSAADLAQLANIVADSNALVLSDEVYEHLVFDGVSPSTLWQHPVLRERTLVVASFGKLLHATGWKVGYCVAAPKWTAEFRKTHQFNVFSVHTPTQYAIADYLKKSAHYEYLPAFFQQKRDHMVAGLKSSRFEVLPSQGTYFLNLAYRNISVLPEHEFAIELLQKHGVATVPMAAFYLDGFSQGYLRLCFAKEEATLNRALEVLLQV